MSEPIFFCAATPDGNFSSTGYFKGATRFLPDCPHQHKTRAAAARCAKRNDIPGTVAATRLGRNQPTVVNHATYEPIA